MSDYACSPCVLFAQLSVGYASAFLSINPQRLGSVPVFKGTHVPVRYLFEYLSKGKTLETFLDDFDGVPREEALAVLQLSYEKVMEGLPRL